MQRLFSLGERGVIATADVMTTVKVTFLRKTPNERGILCLLPTNGMVKLISVEFVFPTCIIQIDYSFLDTKCTLC